MHKEVETYIKQKMKQYPALFFNKDIVDFGALDINGNNRKWFTRCTYVGVDIVKGKNVDYISKTHKFKNTHLYDFVISTEMLEHDVNYTESLKKMDSLVKPSGVLLLTAASIGRKEHGTSKMNPQDSPLTNDYYKNITANDLTANLPLDNYLLFEIVYQGTDIYFFGIKRP